MRNERLTTTQVEDLMDIAQKLDCVTPSVSRAYETFNALRGTKVPRERRAKSEGEF
jgi:hypothetical protein